MSPEFSDDTSVLMRSLIESASVADTIEQITAFAAHTFDTPFVGATLIRQRGKRFETAGPTQPVVREADELQDNLREGPCVDASLESRTLVSNDLVSDPRWPTWAPQVAAMGLHSVLSSEIHGGAGRIGALNIYGAEPRTFTREDTEVAKLLAAQAGVAMSVVEKIQGLTTALESRTVIGQAQGVIMNQFKLEADHAFAVLKRLSQDRNLRLAAVARQIVDGTIRF